MAFARELKSGKFTAVYHNWDGAQRSSGRFTSRPEAERRAEELERLARSAHPDRVQQATATIAEFAPMWLDLHECEPSTKKSYQHVLNAHVLPEFGPTRVAELQREAIVRYLARLKKQGLSPATQRKVRTTLSAMFQFALDNGYRNDFPVNRIKTQRVTRANIVVLRPEEFGKVHRSLPSEGSRTFANVVVSTGCRFGEATALLVRDVDFMRGALTFSKAVQDVGRQHHPDGASRYYVAPYTKGHTHRTVRIGRHLSNVLRSWIEHHVLDLDDLLFPKHLVCPPKQRSRRVHVQLTPDLLSSLGKFRGPNGVEYRHGTMNGYVTGWCRCDYCRQALSDYRYAHDRGRTRQYVRVTLDEVERAVPLIPPRPQRYYEDEPYLDDGVWAKVWKQACKDAGLTAAPTAYQLRHTHASWLIRAGEDWRTVMTRLGHSDPSATSLYVHPVDDDRSSAELMDTLTDW